MEEKILVKSERSNVTRGLCIFFIIVAIIGAIQIIDYYMSEVSRADYLYFSDCSCRGGRICPWHQDYSSAAAYVWSYVWGRNEVVNICAIVTGIGIICLLIYFWLRSYELIVTDKRVYGQTAFGKRVDLPLDSVSAIGSSWPKGIAVGTSSGRIAFLMIKNCDEIHKRVSDLLIERQKKSVATSAPVVKQEAPVSNVDELKKYKELLDMGVITQEEFDTKKKQLLGL